MSDIPNTAYADWLHEINLAEPHYKLLWRLNRLEAEVERLKNNAAATKLELQWQAAKAVEKERDQHRQDLIAAESGYLEETERLCKERDDARAEVERLRARLTENLPENQPERYADYTNAQMAALLRVGNCTANRMGARRIEELSAEVERLRADATRECHWREELEGESAVWRTTCGNTWEFMVDGPDENNCRYCMYYYCMYCGGTIKVIDDE